MINSVGAGFPRPNAENAKCNIIGRGDRAPTLGLVFLLKYSLGGDRIGLVKSQIRFNYNMPERILIVDDDADFRQELRDSLEEYQVSEACSGDECLRILKRANEIDLVILDVRMPGLSGTDVLEEIKKTDPGLGIIILTGHSSKDVAIEALKGHADDYIEKPVDPGRLKEIIEALLTKRRGEPNIMACGIKGKIEKIKQFTLRNRFKKTTLKEAAACVYLSPKYLSRLFKQVAGQSFSNYRLAVKMEAAKELLKKTGYNINQISDKLGYENAESFIRQFKIRARLTPSGYRQKIKKKAKRKKLCGRK